MANVDNETNRILIITATLITDHNTSQDVLHGKSGTSSELNKIPISVPKARLPSFLQLMREWVAETKCRPTSMTHREDTDGNIILCVSFANPECAGAFRYGFTRS